jgi:hypothetical protein
MFVFAFCPLQKPLGEIVVAVVEAELPTRASDRCPPSSVSESDDLLAERSYTRKEFRNSSAHVISWKIVCLQLLFV